MSAARRKGFTFEGPLLPMPLKNGSARTALHMDINCDWPLLGRLTGWSGSSLPCRIFQVNVRKRFECRRRRESQRRPSAAMTRRSLCLHGARKQPLPSAASTSVLDRKLSGNRGDSDRGHFLSSALFLQLGGVTPVQNRKVKLSD